MIRTVLWDIDGTLLDFNAAERNAVSTLFARFSLGPCTDAMLADYAAINVRWWEKLERGEATKPEILVGRFEEFFSRCGIDPSVAAAFNAAYQPELGETVVFMPGAKETVELLKDRVRQYAVTNGTKQAQVKKLSRSGLDRLLDGVFISEDVGFEKPSAAYFDAVLAAIGPVERNEVLIVGDSLTSDMRGGCNAGLHTCRYNPEGKPDPYRLPIDVEIRSLHELPSLLDRFV